MMARDALLRDYDPARLRRILAVFLVALAVPTGVLIWQAYDRLELETFFQYRSQAESLSAQIDNDLLGGIARLNDLQANDFAFVSNTGRVYQRSPLSTLPLRSDLPGVLGYFQIDATGALTTPLLPAAGIDLEDVGIEFDDLGLRREAETLIRGILADNALVETRRALTPAEPSDAAAAGAAESAFDEVVEEGRVTSNAPAAQVLMDRSSRITANTIGRLDEVAYDDELQQKSEIRQRRLAEAQAEPDADRQRTESAALQVSASR
ncbi:MAG: hypothetical protein AAGA61_08995, partial [Pseudomonadota bacterium]